MHTIYTKPKVIRIPFALMKVIHIFNNILKYLYLLYKLYSLLLIALFSFPPIFVPTYFRSHSVFVPHLFSFCICFQIYMWMALSLSLTVVTGEQVLCTMPPTYQQCDNARKHISTTWNLIGCPKEVIFLDAILKSHMSEIVVLSYKTLCNLSIVKRIKCKNDHFT